MRFLQLRQVVDQVRDFHGRLAQYYADSEALETDGRVKLLLSYLADHEQALCDVIEAYGQDAGGGPIRTWFDGTDPDLEIPTLSRAVVHGDLDELTASAVATHDTLIRYYRGMRDRAETPSVRALIDRLIDLEQHESMRMVRDVHMLEDV